MKIIASITAKIATKFSNVPVLKKFYDLFLVAIKGWVKYFISFVLLLIIGDIAPLYFIINQKK